MQEVDEFVDEWTPEPLGSPFTPKEQIHITSVPVVCGANGPRLKLADTGKQVLNLASFNFTGLAGNEIIKVRAIETSGNMMSIAVTLLDSTVQLVRLGAVNSPLL